jgi:hypothetical protein
MDKETVTWMPLKPTFTASKVASLVNMNPFERVFEQVFDTMARHDIPLCTENVMTGQVQLAEKEQLERHIREIVSPHITQTTTVQDLQKIEVSLQMLGPGVASQAVNYARMRFGQVAEQSSVQQLKEEGQYGKGQYKKMEFKDFYLVGQTDGVYNGKIVEIKNRRNRFLGVTSYERPQFECYMRLFEVPDLYLCETLKGAATVGTQQHLTLVQADDELWTLLLQRLTWVAHFMKEVQERPYFQQLEKSELEVQFHSFIAERAVQ